MNQKERNLPATITTQKKIAVVLLLASVVFFSGQISSLGVENSRTATSLQEREKEEKERRQKIKELEEKAKIYQNIIDLKQKQQRNLANQIELLEAEANKIKVEIEIRDRNLSEMNKQLLDLEQMIKEKTEAIEKYKKVLGELMLAFYEFSKSSDYLNLVASRNFSGLIQEKDRSSQIMEKIEQIVSGISSMRQSIIEEKIKIEEKRKEVAKLKIELQEKASELSNLREKKEIVMIQTQGEEERYLEMLARVERQKQLLLGDIDELSANNEEINKLLATLPQPQKGLASTSWYYSQKDPRWGSQRIGQSNSLVKDYGCALTSVAMIFTYYEQKITPGVLSKKSIYDWDLIYWPKNGKVVGLSDDVRLIKNTEHQGVNWQEIDNYLKEKKPVIVFIKAKSNAGHYVVIHHKSSDGDYVVHDPYWGSNIYLSSSIKLLSALYKTSVSKRSIDQMVIYGK